MKDFLTGLIIWDILNNDDEDEPQDNDGCGCLVFIFMVWALFSSNIWLGYLGLWTLAYIFTGRLKNSLYLLLSFYISEILFAPMNEGKLINPLIFLYIPVAWVLYMLIKFVCDRILKVLLKK